MPTAAAAAAAASGSDANVDVTATSVARFLLLQSSCVTEHLPPDGHLPQPPLPENHYLTHRLPGEGLGLVFGVNVRF